jgi:hypothetical protein
MTNAEKLPQAGDHPTVEASMNGRWLTCTALAGMLALAGRAQGAAAPETAPSAFALPVVEFDIAPTFALATGGASDATQDLIAGPQLAAVRYRPRRYNPPPPPGHPVSSSGGGGRSAGSLTQIHGGVFDPDLGLVNGVLLGFRAGPQFEDRVAIGVGADWRFNEVRNSVVISEESIPGGGTREVRRELSRASTHWVPMMAHLQLSPTGKALGLIPYFGVAGGYQMLFLSAEDFETGQAFQGTFGGWGWQAYAGVGIPLAGPMRLTGEVFLNDATVGRDVEDVITGERFRETVDMDGVGARFGIGWGF